VSNPKLHHYVPQFYLRRFADKGRFWVFDKKTGRTFQADVKNVAAERYFHRIPEFVGTDADALEKYFSEIEGGAATITELWFKRLTTADLGGKVLVGRDERWWMSLYMSLQFLRTAEQREILGLVASDSDRYPSGLSENDRANLHARILCGEGSELCERGVVRDIADRIYHGIWVFGRNITETPFFTSDNPIVIRTGDSKLTVKVGILGDGMYLAFPLSPSIILFCHERKGWNSIKCLSNHLSPVLFTQDLVDAENWGQMFMASRFVFSPKEHLDFGRKFLARHEEICLSDRDYPYGDSES
jgi:hypothetical protein